MAYVTPSDLAAWLRIPDSEDDVHLVAAVAAAEESVESYCSRVFSVAASATARIFAAGSSYELDVDDIGSTSGLVVATDDNADGAFETTWASTAYQLEPLNSIAKGWPVYRLRAVGDSTFPVSLEARVQITARWGWPAVPDAVRTATMMHASRLLKRRDAVFGIVDAPSGIAADRLRAAVDPDVAVLLNPYRRMMLA